MADLRLENLQALIIVAFADVSSPTPLIQGNAKASVVCGYNAHTGA
jgi:hypothetical protein